jgi:hypothetical protein
MIFSDFKMAEFGGGLTSTRIFKNMLCMRRLERAFLRPKNAKTVIV